MKTLFVLLLLASSSLAADRPDFGPEPDAPPVPSRNEELDELLGIARQMSDQLVSIETRLSAHETRLAALEELGKNPVRDDESDERLSKIETAISELRDRARDQADAPARREVIREVVRDAASCGAGGCGSSNEIIMVQQPQVFRQAIQRQAATPIRNFISRGFGGGGGGGGG